MVKQDNLIFFVAGVKEQQQALLTISQIEPTSYIKY